jgi:hypothetical protein
VKGLTLRSGVTCNRELPRILIPRSSVNKGKGAEAVRPRPASVAVGSYLLEGEARTTIFLGVALAAPVAVSWGPKGIKRAGGLTPRLLNRCYRPVAGRLLSGDDLWHAGH